MFEQKSVDNPLTIVIRKGEIQFPFCKLNDVCKNFVRKIISCLSRNGKFIVSFYKKKSGFLCKWPIRIQKSYANFFFIFRIYNNKKTGKLRMLSFKDVEAIYSIFKSYYCWSLFSNQFMSFPSSPLERLQYLKLFR